MTDHADGWPPDTIGSAVASVLCSAGGWTAVTVAGMVLGVFALLVWAVGRRDPQILQSPASG